LNLSFFIARRYFRSKKEKSFISIISNISMIGVAIGTMALVIVLSVFNGLEDLIRSLYSSFDPQLKVAPAYGKSFVITDDWLKQIEDIQGVDLVTEIVEDNALVRYKDAQMVVKVKGVADNFIDQKRMDKTIVQGELKLQKDGINYAIIGRGVQYALAVNPKNEFYALQIFYPKNVRPGGLDPSKMYNQKNIMPGATFAIEKQYDENYIFVPLDFAIDLFEYGDKRTSLEIKIKNGFKERQVQRELQSALGNDYQVLTSDEQHSGLLRAIKIEKLFVYLTFSFILAIASFNIFFSLTMLAIDKKKDIAVLYSLGANDKLVKRIFLFEGTLIAFVGAGIGLLLGLLICWMQQRYGLVSMGMQTSVLEAYPVKMELQDFVYTAITIVVITILASYRPAIIATQSNNKDYLK
jgi:lipoprotein-releasing system permease protein